jgi:hypothetical protein
MVHEGGCMCGAVRFKAEGEPVNVRLCHCRHCQLAYGAPFNARALYQQDKIAIDGPVGRYASSDRLDRLFCTACGTRFAAWRKTDPVASLALATFDNHNAFSPTEHIWVSEKINWLVLNDGLPQYQEAFPA